MSNFLRHCSKPVLSCLNNQLKPVKFFSVLQCPTSVNLPSSTSSVQAKSSSNLFGSSLTPVSNVQVCGIKHVARPEKRCRHCYFQVKDEQLFVMCTKHPRHYSAARQKNKKWGNYILTHSTQGATDGGYGKGSRDMRTQNSFRLEY